MKLSNNFKLEELIESSTAIHYKINNYPSPTEIDNLRKLYYGGIPCSIIILSHGICIRKCYRTPILNRKVGGVPTSYHVSGNAVDITTRDTKKNKELFNMIVDMIKNNEIEVGELIDEHNYKWIHISNPVKEKNQILHLG